MKMVTCGIVKTEGTEMMHESRPHLDCTLTLFLENMEAFERMRIYFVCSASFQIVHIFSGTEFYHNKNCINNNTCIK